MKLTKPWLNMQAMNERINELANELYRLEQLNSPEVVIMFVPSKVPMLKL